MHLILPSQSIPIDQAAYDKVDRLRKQIVYAVANRDRFVSDNNLDRAFCTPDANWKDDPTCDFFRAYDHVRAANYDVFNRLRFFVQAFSGYRLPLLEIASGHWTLDPLPQNLDDWLKRHRHAPDVWVRRWRNAIAELPDELIYRPPRMLGEIGWEVKRTIVNHDTYVYQERINLLYENGILSWLGANKSSPVTILEIGGGYGALASALMSVTRARYIICDLPESLLFSASYISLTRPEARIRVCKEAREVDHTSDWDFLSIPNYMFQTLIEKKFPIDLALNTLSLTEMSAHQVATYCHGISELIGNTGLFFEQNQDNRHLGFQTNGALLGGYFQFNQECKAEFCFGTEGKAHIRSNFKPALKSVRLSAPQRFIKFSKRLLRRLTRRQRL